MKQWALAFDSISGEIKSAFDFTDMDEIAPMILTGQSPIVYGAEIPPVDLASTYYVQPGPPPQLVARPAMPGSVDKTTIKIGGVPPNGVATFSGLPYNVVLTGVIVSGSIITYYGPQTLPTGGAVYTTGIVGTHTLTMTLFPYVPKVFVVTATP